MTTYECTICFNVNHASKLACSACGVTPSQYSLIGRPSVSHDNQFTEVVIAYGVERCTSHHATKAPMRTVSALYYAEGE